MQQITDQNEHFIKDVRLSFEIKLLKSLFNAFK